MCAGVSTPLWPAGHLPHKGRDQQPEPPSPVSIDSDEPRHRSSMISPLVGEMAGRPEGGDLRNTTEVRT